MLPVKKIYVDSKYKTPDSISDSNFLNSSYHRPLLYLMIAGFLYLMSVYHTHGTQLMILIAICI